MGIARLGLISLLLVCASVRAEDQVVVDFPFDQEGDLGGWLAGGCIADLAVSGGCLRGRVVDWDPILLLPPVAFAATPSQVIELTISCPAGGGAQVYYTNTLETQYGGFSPEKAANFGLSPGVETRTYRIRPFWHAEGTVIRLRLDLPASSGEFAIDRFRVIDEGAREPVEARWSFAAGSSGWRTESGVAAPTGRALAFTPTALGGMLWAPPIRIAGEDNPFVCVRMAAKTGTRGVLHFATARTHGETTVGFDLHADGAMHTYNVEVGADSGWRGEVFALGLEPVDIVGARATFESIVVGDGPSGPAELEVRGLGLDDVVNRADEPCMLTAEIVNVGGEVARGLRTRLRLPEGVAAETAEEPLPLDVEFGFPETRTWFVRAERPLQGEAVVELLSGETVVATATATLEFTPKVAATKLVPYVPEPEAVESDYRVGAYYFPGWNSRTRWNPIEGYPERKPVLGWYDESLPAVADWQIKWAVEHGISFFVVDWYWSQGARSLEHWLHNAYAKARYRDQLQYCLLWANHNPEGSSSLDDCLAVTQYWIDNYFKDPQYLRIGGKPVMVIFTPYRLRADMGSEEVAKAFEAMDTLCRQNGIPGIYMVACAGSSKSEIEQLAAEGYDALSGYNYAGLNAQGRRSAPYETLIDGYKDLWNEAADAALLPEIPVLSGGWDSRPWHGANALVRTGRTPALFERHCRDAKEFLDKRVTDPELKMCIIEACNEWGEGSYIEPHREYGFQYYDAIRRVFTDAPERHTDLTPKDVGLRPYDFPALTLSTSWDFDDGSDQGWTSTMALERPTVVDGALRLVTTGTDPAIYGPPTSLRAASYPAIEIRMRADRADEAQLFFSTSTGPTTEARSIRFPFAGDGEWHTYRLDMAAVPAWRGRITGLRFDVGSHAGVTVEIDWVRPLNQ